MIRTLQASLLALSLTSAYSLSIDITGSKWNDTIVGSIDDDRLLGNSGNDQLSGLEGNDYINGQSGNDIINGDQGDDKLYGELGDDLIYGGAGNDYINGGKQHDSLFGGDGDDIIFGGNFEDKLDGGKGQDTLIGEIGHDTYYFKPGYGKDLIKENDSFFVFSDTLIVTDLEQDDFVYAKADGSDLIIVINDGADVVKILNWYTAEDHKLNNIEIGNYSYTSLEVESSVVNAVDLLIAWLNGATFNDVLFALNPDPSELPTQSEFNTAYLLTYLKPGPFQSYSDIEIIAGSEIEKLISHVSTGMNQNFPTKETCLAQGSPAEICNKLDLSK